MRGMGWRRGREETRRQLPPSRHSFRGCLMSTYYAPGNGVQQSTMRKERWLHSWVLKGWIRGREPRETLEVGVQNMMVLRGQRAGRFPWVSLFHRVYNPKEKGESHVRGWSPSNSLYFFPSQLLAPLGTGVSRMPCTHTPHLEVS